MGAGGEDGQLVEALGEAEPRRPPVREQEASPVGELEVGSRRGTGVIGSYRQAGKQEAERLDGLEHQANGGMGQDLALPRRGLLYAPVVVNVGLVGPGFVYTPAYAVNDDHGVDAAVTTVASAPALVEDRNDAVDDND